MMVHFTIPDIILKQRAYSDIWVPWVGVIGLVLLLFGRRFLRGFLFLLGFCIGGIGGLLLYQAIPQTKEWALETSVATVSAMSLIFGLILGTICCTMWRIGLAIIGAAMGWGCWQLVYTAARDKSVDLGWLATDPARPILMAVLPVLSAILFVMLHQIMTVLLSSILGAAFVLCTCDHYGHTGFIQMAKEILSKILSDGVLVTKNDPHSLGNLIAWAVVTILGIGFQCILWRIQVRSPGKANSEQV